MKRNKRKRKFLGLLLTVAILVGAFSAAQAFAMPIVDTTPQNVVYISISDEGKYVESPVDGTLMAYVSAPLSEVEAIDLDDYGMGEYYYDADGDGNYETTLMQLFIYVMERYYGEGTWANVNVGGYGSGHTYLQNGFWGHDDNLTYYMNGLYPLDASLGPGQGATSDHIALSPGDFCDISMYSDRDFWTDGNAGYHYFRDAGGVVTHHYDAVAGEPLSVSLGRAWGDLFSGGDTVMSDEPDYEVYYGLLYGAEDGRAVTDADGKTTVLFDQAGTYCLWVDGGVGQSTANVVSSPGFATVTVKASAPVLSGDVTGDGIVDVRDARAILRFVGGSETFVEAQLAVADVTGDGIVDVRDARAIINAIVG